MRRAEQKSARLLAAFGANLSFRKAPQNGPWWPHLLKDLLVWLLQLGRRVISKRVNSSNREAQTADDSTFQHVVKAAATALNS
jgi:hypothetical protein